MLLAAIRQALSWLFQLGSSTTRLVCCAPRRPPPGLAMLKQMVHRSGTQICLISTVCNLFCTLQARLTSRVTKGAQSRHNRKGQQGPVRTKLRQSHEGYLLLQAGKAATADEALAGGVVMDGSGQLQILAGSRRGSVRQTFRCKGAHTTA